MEKTACIILAGGLGRRLGDQLPKVLTPTREKSLIAHILDSIAPLNLDKTILVTGHKRELLEKEVKNGAYFKEHLTEFAYQSEQLGTGHAAKCALPNLEGFVGTVLLLYGDIPLIRTETIQLLIKLHQEKKATLSLVSFKAHHPNPYGRLIRNQNGALAEIVEMKDCNAERLLVDEVNLGIYAVDSAFLAPALKELQNNNSQKEYYLTDIVAKAIREGQTVTTMLVPDNREAQGVNTPQEMEIVNRQLAERQISSLIQSGVIFVDPSSVFLDVSVKISKGAVIGPNVQLRGNTIVEEEVTIEGTALIKDSIIKKGADIRLGVRIEDSAIGERAIVGPFAHLRPGTKLGAEVKIGNFVETKNAEIADGAKASHLTYLGDCSVGTGTNIGAGTITCNYDGVSKNRTTIGKDAFIGSDSVLIAPITIADGAYVGAGSVISKDVPADSLAFTRAKLTVKEGWAKKKFSSK